MENDLSAIALRILTSGIPISRKGGSFLGQVVVDPSPMTDKQARWFEQLAAKAGIEWEVA